MATPQSNAYPLTMGTEQLPSSIEEAAGRSHARSPPWLPLRTDDLPFITGAAGDAPRRLDSLVDPTSDSPGSRTQENSPTRYEPYITTSSGRKPRMTEKVKAAGGWTRLHASVRTRGSKNKVRHSNRRGAKDRIQERPRQKALRRRNQFLNANGELEFPTREQLLRLTKAERGELKRAIRIS